MVFFRTESSLTVRTTAVLNIHPNIHKLYRIIQIIQNLLASSSISSENVVVVL